MKQKHILTAIMLLTALHLFSAVSLPLSYDLRDVEGNTYVSSVKSQQGGTCWAHAVMAAIESNLMRTEAWPDDEPAAEPDLSEYHLDWWNGFNLFYNEDIGFYPEQGLTVHMGGDYRVASAYLSRGDGAIRDMDAQSYDIAPERHDSSYHYYYPRKILWFQLQEELSNIDLIKYQLMEHGALGTSMYVGMEFLNDSTNGSFYQPPEDPHDPNHAIAIIGWNDTISTAAPSPGAWLCKNSWGASWGSRWDGNGYFWISYYDKHAGRHPEMGCISFQEVEPMRYDDIYYHDYHGWRDTLPVQEAVNIFVAEKRDSLTAVSFYTAADSVNYAAKIYRSRKHLNEERYITEQSGFASFSGFYTIDLDHPVSLMKDDSFYVHLYLDKGGHAYDRSSEVPVLLNVPSVYALPATETTVPSRAEKNESLYKINGQWRDLQYVDTTANFCIKALVNESKFTRSGAVPETGSLSAVFPNPVHRNIIIDYQLAGDAEITISLYDIKGRKVTTFLRGLRPAGYHWLEADLSGLSSGIYICMLKTGNQLADTRKILVIK